MTVRPLVFQLAHIALLSGVALAQQPPIGTVGVQDANVTGALEIANGRAVLVGSTSVTAKDRTAEIALGRGGKVLVCATSGLHLTSNKAAQTTQPLMLALDRGAIEVQTATTASDVILTPDLRLSIQGAGPLDLRLRVAKNGDTCVESRGANAPTLHISDQFGEASYDVHSGQHVMFEHASLKEVVDSESSPCGCPPVPVVSVADAGVTSSTPAVPGSVVATKQAEAQHPFPAAISQGLAPNSEVPAAPAGVVHTQVATTLSYDATAKSQASGNSAGSSPEASSANPASTGSGTTPNAATSAPATVRAEVPPPPAAPSGTHIARSIGRFFKRLFGKG